MAGLKQAIGLGKRLKRPAAPPLSPGGEARMKERAGFGFNPGALKMLAYVPDDLAPGAPLVVVLHGCTQTAEAHAWAGGWLTLADRCGFVVVAPEQNAANNPNRCFNWFEPGDIARGCGEAASIRAMVACAIRDHGLDPDRVFVTGLSAGGAMAAAMLAAYPDVFAAGAVVAGLPYGVAGNMNEAFGVMQGRRTLSAAELGGLVLRAGPPDARTPRISIWQGGADGTVNPRNAAELARQWATAHGLPLDPSETRILPGSTRARWRSPDTGEVLVESHLIRGLGHGTPLSTGGPDGIGAAAPFMIEAGVSSSLEIARFWGLADPADEERAGAPTPEATVRTGSTDESSIEESASTLGRQVMASLSGQVPADVQDVIEKALRDAGLMR